MEGEGIVGVDWIDVARDSASWRAVVDTVMNGSHKLPGIFD
jgi:hypothetical protein